MFFNLFFSSACFFSFSTVVVLLTAPSHLSLIFFSFSSPHRSSPSFFRLCFFLVLLSFRNLSEHSRPTSSPIVSHFFCLLLSYSSLDLPSYLVLFSLFFIFFSLASLFLVLFPRPSPAMLEPQSAPPPYITFRSPSLPAFYL